jgi:glycerol uptake facilitator protein
MVDPALTAEFIGTMLLIILGDGVVANVVLKKTKGNNSGWIVITAGWAFAVTVGVYASKAASGAHLNPAVTIAQVVGGGFAAPKAIGYIIAQMAGAIAGATLVWLAYRPHFEATEDQAAKLAVFATGPAIRKPVDNLLSEIIGTFVLMLGLLLIFSKSNFKPGTELEAGFSPILVGLLVWAIGVSLGGTTGYAINPARDLGPRIAHAILPIAGKGSSDWGYAWIPVAGPIIGAVLAVLVHGLLGL